MIAVVVRAGQPRISLFGFGGGAQDTDPFLIGTAAQLAEIATLTNNGQLEIMFLGTDNGTVHLKLDNNIDLSGYAAGEGWVPIGRDFANFFKGSFDGGGHVITGLYINRDANYQGLFVFIGGTVQNLGVIGANITSKSRVGGVAGAVDSGGTVKNCYSTGEVSGTSRVGGIAGETNNAPIKNCYSIGSITGTNQVGGIVGDAMFSGAVIENCYSVATIQSESWMTGGIAGYVGGSDGNYASVKNCTALNPSVSCAGGGRVVGANFGTLLQSNIAFSGMLVGGIVVTGSGAADLKNGLSKTAAALIANTDNVLSSRFTAENGWSYTVGGLPILLGADGQPMPGQDTTMPAHIVDGNDPNFRGAGTEANPYQISTPEQLANLAKLVNARNADYNDKHYKLTADIDLAGIDPNGDDSGWAPIGDKETIPFKGSFDGGGHVITGLYINRDANNQGLFGCIYGGTVQNLGVVNASVSGNISVGGVAGYVHKSTVENCTALNPKVTGNGHFGRVVGVAESNGTLQNNYAYDGMLVNGSTVSGGTLSDKNGLDKSADEIRGWDESFWTATAGWSTANWQFTTGGLPILKGEDGNVLPGQNSTLPDHLLAEGAVPFEGEGTSGKPYLIKTAADLAKLAELVNGGNGFVGKYFKLENDLDLSGIDPNGDDSGWVPIGNTSNSFNGSFNGGGHKITGLTINRKDTDSQGLFGYIYGGTVKNLGVVNASVTGNIYVGGVVGNVYQSTLENCYSTGKVSGSEIIGGLAGGFASGTVKNCYSTGEVSGSNTLGGIVGLLANFDAKVTNCYSAASVTGTGKEVGGVVGYLNMSSVENCYATGIVRGATQAGGVVGYAYGTVTNSVALNASVVATGTDGIACRVAGSHGYGTLKNNYAYTGMTVKVNNADKEPLDKGADSIDGADLTSATLFGGSFWTTEANWASGSWSDTSIWTVEDGKLPTLIGLGGQSGVPDLYLRQLSTDQLSGSLSGAGISESGNSYTAQASYTAQTVTVTVTGMADWTNPAVTITAKKTSGGEAISVTPTGNGSGTFDIPAEFSGNITVTATSDGNPVNKRSVTLAVNKRTLSETDFSGIIPTDHVYNRLQQGIGDISFVGVVLTFKYNGSEIAPTDAGTYAVILHYAGDTVYNATEAEGLAIGDYKIAPKPVTITPNPNQSKQYGAADPVLVYSNNGGLTTGDFSGALSRASGENVGNYPITLGTLSAGDNYQLSLVSGTVNFIIEQAKVQSISTTVSNVSKTAYEVRNATAAQEVVNMAGLPSSVSVTTDGGTATLPITWATSTAYDAKSASYTVIGTLTGNSNIDSNSVITSVTVAVTPVTAVNPTFGDTLAVINSDSAATAAALGSAILPASGSIAVEGESIAYTIDWNGGETLDRTTVGNERAFTGTISYTAPPPWLTLPSGLSVSRKVTVTDKTFVTIGGITTADRAYDGASYAPSGTVTVAGGSVPVNQLEWLYESTDGAGYSNSAAPTAAGAYKLTIYVSVSNSNYAGS